VLVDQTRIGSWRRTVQPDRVVVETLLAPGVTNRPRALVADAVAGLGAFLGLPVEHRAA
jgi:hypothetical protein